MPFQTSEMLRIIDATDVSTIMRNHGVLFDVCANLPGIVTPTRARSILDFTIHTKYPEYTCTRIGVHSSTEFY